MLLVIPTSQHPSTIALCQVLGRAPRYLPLSVEVSVSNTDDLERNVKNGIVPPVLPAYCGWRQMIVPGLRQGPPP